MIYKKIKNEYINMAIPITLIQGSDNVALSRLTINSNFSALKAGTDALMLLLNPTTFTLSGVKSVQIDDSAASLATTILSVTKGASILGNLTLGTIGDSTSVLINGIGGTTFSESSVTLNTGNLTLTSASSLLQVGGNISMSKEVRMPGISTAQSSMISLTSSATYAIGSTGAKYIFVSNGSTSSIAPYGLTASLSSGTPGQVVEIYHVKGPSGSVHIDTSNFVGLTGPIILSKSGDKIKCIYESGWYLWEAYPANIFVSGVTGSSSISFTRS